MSCFYFHLNWHRISAIQGAALQYLERENTGSIMASGSNVNQVITFTPVTPTLYTITFKESGLPSGTSWSVTLNRVTETSTTNTITFHEPTNPTAHIPIPSPFHQAIKLQAPQVP